MKQTPLTKLKTRVSALEKNVSFLSDSFVKGHNLSTQIIGMAQRNIADLLVLRSMVQEIAEQHGIEPDQFKRHYQLRFDFWYDHVLRGIEDQSPDLAAAIDPRELFSFGVETSYPPLFE
jgi:hypothetical protein